MSSQRKKLLRKLKNKYRLVIMNDQTFEEKFSLKLTPMNLFIAMSSGIILFTILICTLIFYTPLKEYVPGYADPDQQRNVAYLMLKTDSLEQALIQRDAFIRNLQDVMNGREPGSEEQQPDQDPDSLTGMAAPGPHSYENDSAFMAEMEAGDDYALQENEPARPGISSYTFLPPVKGLITEKFSYSQDHFAIDVVSKVNEPVKATLDGTIIFAAWNPETGHVIGVQHGNDLVSIYKHNAVLLKKVGTFVSAGDAIAIVGNSGELTTGPHLHFELWYRGNPVNPEEYMVF